MTPLEPLGVSPAQQATEPATSPAEVPAPTAAEPPAPAQFAPATSPDDQSAPQGQALDTPIQLPSAPDAQNDAAAPGGTVGDNLIPSAAPVPGDAEAAPGDGAEAATQLAMPHDLSPWGMYMGADIVVKAVMIGLAFASIVTWTIWLAKSIELSWAKRRLVNALSRINASISLAEASQRLGSKTGVVAGLIDLAAVELRLSSDISDKSGIKERVSSRLDGLASAAGRDMNRGTGLLATIGSTSPFVGLFGTVWGIMNSFIGIAETQTTNLAVVAPGIAEALLATALGLVAAIPAVIIYNQFARSIAGYRAMIGEASAEVMRLVSRDLDRGMKIAPARAAE